MSRLKTKKAIILTLISVIIFGGLFYYLIGVFTAKAQEQIKIFPASFAGDWQNPEAVFIQDLNEGATFEEFNATNSAYPLKQLQQEESQPTSFWEKVKNFFEEAVFAQEEPAIEEPAEVLPEEPVIEEPIIEEKIAPVEKVLELSNFSLSGDFGETEIINNIQLRLSLAGRGEVGDKLTINYYCQDSWQSLAVFDLENEISNNLNGGYFLYALPIFESWADLENLKIRFVYQGQENAEVYLDSLWLEITTEEQPQELIEEQPQQEIQQEYNQATEIKTKYKLDGVSLKRIAKDDPKDMIRVEIGDNTKTEFEPTLRISRWDEVSFKISPKIDGIATRDKTLSFEGNKIKFGTPKVEYQLYDLGITEEHPEGGYEFEVIFKEKPATNKIEFTLNTKGLDFFYQPELTAEEIAQGDFRPENVVGSYAVYASEQKTNYVGGKEYKVGKVGHIFRPKIIDSTGTEVWGNLHIENGILSVTIPQDFLDTGIYPIIVDPTFGYTSNGESNSGERSHNILGSKFALTETGTLSSISVYYWTYGTQSMVHGVYDSNLNLVEHTSAGFSDYPGGWVLNWKTLNLLTNPSKAAADYWLVSNHNGTNTVNRYDTGSANQGLVLARYYDGDMPASIASPAYNTRKFSIYCTYTPLPALTVTTQAVTAITGGATATGNGNITELGDDANADKRGFVYDTTSRGDPGDVAPGDSDYVNYVEDTDGFPTGAFTKTLTSLSADETYYVRAYAHGDTEGYAYGNEVSFENVAVPLYRLKTQGGTTTITNGNTSIDVTLDSNISDLSRAFLVMKTSGDVGATLGENHQATGYLWDDSGTTKIKFERDGNTDDCQISYYVVETVNEDFTVQRDGTSITDGNATVDDDFTTAITEARTVLISNSRSDTISSEGFAIGEFKDTDTVTFTRNDTSNVCTIRYEVVEWSTESEVNIYTGEQDCSGDISSGVSTDITAHGITKAQTWLFATFRHAINGLEQTAICASLTSDTAILWQRYDQTTNYASTGRYWLIEFPSDVVVQHSGVVEVASTDFTEDYTCDEINELTAWGDHYNSCNGTGTAFPRGNWIDYFNSSTVLRAERFYNGQAAEIAFEVIDTSDWTYTAGGGTAALTGTAVPTITEADVRTGGKTIIITLTGDTWVATVGEDNAITTALIAGIDSDQAEAAGWDAVVKANMVYTDTARTSDTVVTVTLGDEATYDITATETITVTIPATAVTLGAEIVATPTFTVTAVANQAPTVDSINISPSPIDLNADTTKTVTITATITDNDGCEDVFTSGSITGVFFDDAAENDTCTQDDNDCYTSLTLTEVDNTCTGAGDYTADASVDVNVWFIANPSSSWTAKVTATDEASESGSNTQTVTINTLIAFDLDVGSIAYGTVNPDAVSSQQAVLITTIGNVAIDVQLSGTNLTWSGNTILVGQQKYSNQTGFDWETQGTALTDTPYCHELSTGKPTEHPSVETENVYWKLKVPTGKPAGGPYSGTNYFDVVSDTSCP